VKIVRCPVCLRDPGLSRPDVVVRYPQGPLRIFKCSCGLRFSEYALNGIPPGLYGHSYYDHVRYRDQEGSNAYLAHLADFFNRGLAATTPEGRKLLDVGCATGDFVAWALRAGWEAEGIDISSDAVEIGKRRNLPVTQADLLALPDPLVRYDVITLWDVLEHLPDVQSALLVANKVLRPGGLVFLKTVSSFSLLERMARAIYHLSIGVVDGPLKRFLVPGHLYYFGQKNLETLLANCGFDLLRLENSDTPSRALFRSRVMTAAFDLIYFFQRATRTGYELLAVCRSRQ
jgi:SAM-dependent methyltransferase